MEIALTALGLITALVGVVWATQVREVSRLRSVTDALKTQVTVIATDYKHIVRSLKRLEQKIDSLAKLEGGDQ